MTAAVQAVRVAVMGWRCCKMLSGRKLFLPLLRSGSLLLLLKPRRPQEVV